VIIQIDKTLILEVYLKNLTIHSLPAHDQKPKQQGLSNTKPRIKNAKPARSPSEHNCASK